jgi:hypothetical protein
LMMITIIDKRVSYIIEFQLRHNLRPHVPRPSYPYVMMSLVALRHVSNMSLNLHVLGL